MRTYENVFDHGGPRGQPVKRHAMHASIAVLPGDGIGPEVTSEAVHILHVVAERWGHALDTQEALIGGCAIDATGEPLPAETTRLALSTDAVLLGAVGGPQWSDPNAAVRPEQGLLDLRRALGTYANLRPISVHPALAAASPLKPDRLAGVDLLFVRELTGGMYFGEKTRQSIHGGERATDLCVYTTGEIARVVRVAARLARERRHKLTSVDKANVLETSRLWRRVTERVVHDEFPDVTLDHMFVDACAMRLVQAPGAFDVIVTENLFGDILTDEASMLAGSIGMLPSASLGDVAMASEGAPGPTTRPGLYEPIHGSAPDIAGRGVANPIGAILSVAMLLRHSLGLHEEARAVERAVSAVVADGWGTPDIAASDGLRCSTRELGERIAVRLFEQRDDATRTIGSRDATQVA
jgi:3-isopropylmalate dehydrogenase